jgi:hypothetical protein
MTEIQEADLLMNVNGEGIVVVAGVEAVAVVETIVTKALGSQLTLVGQGIVIDGIVVQVPQVLDKVDGVRHNGVELIRLLLTVTLQITAIMRNFCSLLSSAKAFEHHLH